jgi:hypothetical protein
MANEKYGEWINGGVTRFSNLPGANKTPEELKKDNWFIVKYDDREIKPYQKIESRTYTKLGDEVIETLYVTNLSLAEFRTMKITEIKLKASNDILSVYPAYKQINAAMGIYSAEKTLEIKNFIADIKSRVDAREEDILASDSLDEINGM